MNKHSQGFTLLELLVAVVVFAIMATMAYSSLGIALSHRQQAEVQAERLAELQKVFTIMGRDIEQAINRPVRGNYAYGPADKEAPLKGSEYGSSILELTRTGLSNPMKMKRSRLQRVGYVLSEGDLVRQSWFVLDRIPDTEPYESVILSEVESVQLQFMNDQYQWRPSWPENTATTQSPSPFVMPRAVEVIVELEHWGRMRRVFEVAG